VGQKLVKFSDLSGELITDEDAVARIVIHEHPELDGGPVEIEVQANEALAAEKAAVKVALLELFLPGEDEPRRVAVDLAAFDKLATDQPMTDLLANARPARRVVKPREKRASREPDRAADASTDSAPAKTGSARTASGSSGSESTASGSSGSTGSAGRRSAGNGANTNSAAARASVAGAAAPSAASLAAAGLS